MLFLFFRGVRGKGVSGVTLLYKVSTYCIKQNLKDCLKLYIFKFISTKDQTKYVFFYGNLFRQGMTPFDKKYYFKVKPKRLANNNC